MAVVSPTALIPIPAKLTPRSGTFKLGATTSIVAGNDLRAQADLLRDLLRPATGLPLAVASSGTGSRITLALDPSLAGLGDEGYRLTVTGDEAAIRAHKPGGILHGSQTLRQLLPPAVFRRAPGARASWGVPGPQSEGPPRFGR